MLSGPSAFFATALAVGVYEPKKGRSNRLGAGSVPTPQCAYSASTITVLLLTSTTPPFTGKISEPLAVFRVTSPALSTVIKGAWLLRKPRLPSTPGTVTLVASPLKSDLSGVMISTCMVL